MQSCWAQEEQDSEFLSKGPGPESGKPKAGYVRIRRARAGSRMPFMPVRRIDV